MFRIQRPVLRLGAGEFASKSRSGVLHAAIYVSLALVTAGFCSAATISLTGILATPESTEEYSFSLAAPGNVTLQSYGFGGGLNAAGVTIPAGGFDPFVGLFSGSGNSAVFVDGTADSLSNYLSEPAACPPAGLVEIGNVSGQCGDLKLQFTALAAGSYTVILSDAGYIPNAVYEAPGGTLGDGFSDLTSGTLPLSTCYDLSDCNTDSANWALDVTTPTVVATAPEPVSFGFAAMGLALVAGVLRRHNRHFIPGNGSGSSLALDKACRSRAQQVSVIH